VQHVWENAGRSVHGAAILFMCSRCVPQCALAVSHWHENFILSVDPYGSLLGVSYRTPLSDCSSASEQRAALAGADAFTLVPKAKISFGKVSSGEHSGTCA